MPEHDLVVIGGGPAGYAAALYAASAGLNVGIVEKDKLGGTCLHVGCIPAKELLESAAVFTTISSAGEFGITTGSPELDMKKVQARKSAVITKLAKGLESTIKGRGIDVYSGTGSLASDGSPNESSNGSAGKVKKVKVESQENGTLEIDAKNIILAAGSTPNDLSDLKPDGKQIVNSDHLLSWDKIPKSIAIIGAGAIGVEFASLFSDLGSQVLLLEALPRILAGVDKDIARVIEKSFKKRGMEISEGVEVSGYDPAKQTLSYKDKAEEAKTAEVEVVALCVGRKPSYQMLGLDENGIKVNEDGSVKVNEFCETSLQGIYAVGDLIKTPQLAHIGFAEGILAVKHILGEEPIPIDYAKVPWGIYCQPEVAFAGLSEEAAKAEGHEVEVSKHSFIGNGRAQILGETEGMVKVVADKDTTQILGVHMAGPWVTEQLGAGYLAVNWEADAADVANFIFPHPTLSEMFSEAAMSLLGRPLHG